jgi:hypothetical protein
MSTISNNRTRSSRVQIKRFMLDPADRSIIQINNLSSETYYNGVYEHGQNHIFKTYFNFTM